MPFSRESIVWGVTSTVACALITGVVLMGPSLLIICGLFAAIITILLMLKPKLLVLVAVLGITFSRTIEQISGLPAAGYVDEALILLAAVTLMGGRLLRGRTLRPLPGGKWFIGFIAVGLFSGIMLEAVPVVVIQGAFLSAKALILAWAVSQIDWSPDDLRRAMKPGMWVVGILLVGAVLNLAAPQAWANAFQSLAFVQYRVGGLPSLISFTVHPLDFGGLAALSTLALAVYRHEVRKTKANGLFLWGMALSTLLTFRRASISGLIGASVLTLLRKYRAGVVIFGAVSIPAVLIMVWEPLVKLMESTYAEYFLEPDRTARTLLTLDSFEVAAYYFPFGAGFSRFGSFLAWSNYSPEYVERGYMAVYGMGPGEQGRFLTDTQWPAIIGETGFVGAAMFIVGIFMILRRFWMLRRHDEPMVRWLAGTGMAWIAFLLISSLAVPSFYAGTFFASVFTLVGVSAAFDVKAADKPISETAHTRAIRAQLRSR